MAKFVAIPKLTQGLTTWQRLYMGAIAENTELLTGQRGDSTKAAILRGDVINQVDFLDDATGTTVADAIAEINATNARFNLLLTKLKGV